MSIILTPMEFSGTQQLERRLFRKKVLPVDAITYDGRKIDFTPEYLEQMVQSFNDGAFDNVPLQFASDDNGHTNKIERYRGDVVAMTADAEGLYVTVSATTEGAKWLQENPKVGISARIVNDYDRADGKHYDTAMQHVLVTHDPRIPGLGPWSEVNSFSNSDDSDIIDLTGEKFPAKKTKKEKSVPKKDDGLSDDELGRLRAFLAELDEDPEVDEVDAGTDEDVDAELTDDELHALLAELDAEIAEEAPVVSEPVLADATLSNPSTEALELARSQSTELSRIRGELDEQKWSNERVALMKTHGLPPSIIDKAKPLLKGEGHVLEFSNGDKVDAGGVMRDVLHAVGDLAKLLDLSHELGSSVDEPDLSDDARTKRDDTTKAVRAMMGN